VGDEGVRRMSTPLTCATDGRLKLLRRGDRDELYDLVADPLELSPVPLGEGSDEVAGDHGSALTALRRALDQAGDEPARSSAPPSANGAGLEPLDDAEREDLERRMRLMGYL
jgi:hypothetical protein